MKIGIVTASIYETIMPACDMLIRMMQYPTNPTPMHVERKKKEERKKHVCTLLLPFKTHIIRKLEEKRKGYSCAVAAPVLCVQNAAKY